MITITTGDKREFQFLVRQSNNEISYEFNNSIYDYINKEKSFVDRRNVKSRMIPIVGILQGENHQSETEQFRISSLDKNYWIVNHPIYGVIYGQPIKVTFKNEDLNTTTIEIEFWETIIDSKGVDSVISPREKLNDSYSQLTTSASNAYEVEDKKNLQDSLNNVRDNYSSLYYNNIDEFLDQYQNVSKSIDLVFSYPERYIQDVYSFNNLIKNVKTNIADKISRLQNIFDFTMSNINTSSKFKEISGASTLATMAQSIIDLDTKMLTRLELVQLNKTVVDNYNLYFSQLESSELDFELQSNLYSMIWTAVYNLFNVTYNARQEREYICKEDTNIILLTYQFMGIVSDENLRFFKKINNINTNELLEIKKGRIVKYYV